jgi:hypothetical protein
LGLTAEQVKKLLAKPARERGKGKKAIDPTVRDLETWFKLGPKALDEITAESMRCENENCIDPRPPSKTSTGVEVKVQYTVRINGLQCCRFCFLDGWLLPDPDQLKVA